MQSSRRLGREAALQAIYLLDVCAHPVEEMPEAGWSTEPLAAKTREFAQHLAWGTSQYRSNIDTLITKYAENWEMHRMAAIDRCILRLAGYELLYELDTPVNVIINEAVEIAKKFSTAESGKFVNGILDKLKNERQQTTAP